MFFILVLDEANTCAMCATVRPPGPGPPLTDWVSVLASERDDCSVL